MFTIIQISWHSLYVKLKWFNWLVKRTVENNLRLVGRLNFSHRSHCHIEVPPVVFITNLSHLKSLSLSIFYGCYREDLDKAMTTWCESKTNELFHIFSLQPLQFVRNGNLEASQASSHFSMLKNAFGNLRFITRIWILNFGRICT